MLRSPFIIALGVLFSTLTLAQTVPLDYFSELEKIGRNVFEKEEKEGWKALDEKEQTLSLIQIMSAEIANGGVEQFFSNSSGEKTLATLDALKKTGDLQTADEFQKTFVIFKNGTPPQDGERKTDPFAESTPAILRVLEWFNDYMTHCSAHSLHLYVYYQTGKPASVFTRKLPLNPKRSSLRTIFNLLMWNGD